MTHEAHHQNLLTDITSLQRRRQTLGPSFQCRNAEMLSASADFTPARSPRALPLYPAETSIQWRLEGLRGIITYPMSKSIFLTFAERSDVKRAW